MSLRRLGLTGSDLHAVAGRAGAVAVLGRHRDRVQLSARQARQLAVVIVVPALVHEVALAVPGLHAVLLTPLAEVPPDGRHVAAAAQVRAQVQRDARLCDGRRINRVTPSLRTDCTRYFLQCCIVAFKRTVCIMLQ